MGCLSKVSLTLRRRQAGSPSGIERSADPGHSPEVPGGFGSIACGVRTQSRTGAPMDQQATVAAVIALSAACAFAVSNALQHRAASGVPAGVSKVSRVLLHLVRNPWWLVGTGLSFIGMLLHATALRWGSLAFVQPLLLVGLVLAIPVRAALERKLPLPQELRAVAITAVGLATYLSSVTLAPGQATPRREVAIAMTVARAPARSGRCCRGSPVVPGARPAARGPAGRHRRVSLRRLRGNAEARSAPPSAGDRSRSACWCCSSWPWQSPGSSARRSTSVPTRSLLSPSRCQW